MDKTIDPVVVVYSPVSQVRTPGRLLRAMITDIAASRELAWRLFVRDLSALYRQSLLGVFWAFIPPVITSLIFIVLQNRRVINFGETDIPYPLYVLVGTILWQIFAESLNAPLKAITAAKPLLVKINFPREALVISAFYLVLFNLLVRFVILAVIFAIFQIQLSWGMLLALPVFLVLILFGMGIGLLLTPLGLLYTDIGTSLPIVTQLLFFITPVVYPLPQTPPFNWISFLNPISPLLIGARDLLTRGTASNSGVLFWMTGVTLGLVVFSWVVYRIALPIIIERMSA